MYTAAVFATTVFRNKRILNEYALRIQLSDAE